MLFVNTISNSKNKYNLYASNTHHIIFVDLPKTYPDFSNKYTNKGHISINTSLLRNLYLHHELC